MKTPLAVKFEKLKCSVVDIFSYSTKFLLSRQSLLILIKK